MSFYISSDLVLSDTDGDNRPNAPLIGYRSLVTYTNITADEEADGFPATNLSTPATHELWKGTSTDPQYVTVDLGEDDSADYFGIARHNFGSTEATVQLQVSDDGMTWDDVGEELSPEDNSPLMHRFTLTESRYWRLSITPGSAAPQMAVFYLGRLLVLQRNIYGGHKPISMSYENVSSVGVSDSGQYLGAVARRANPATTVALKNLTAAWVRANLHPFFTEAVGNGVTRIRASFFFAWRPTSYPAEVGYGWIPPGSPPSLQNQATGVAMMDASFAVQGAV